MSVATKGQHSKEVLELLQSIQDTEKDQMSWKDSTKALDKMEDLSEDGEENPVDGTTIMKEGKYKNGKMSMALKDIYTTDKNYVEWVRSHIDKTSSKEMQRLKVYTLCRDQTKKHRLLIEQEVKTRVPELGKAKNKAMPRGVKNPRAVSESSMEWSCGEPGARSGHPGDDGRHASAPGESPSAQPQQRRTGADDGDADASEHCAGEPRTVDEQVLSKKNRVKLLKNVNNWCSEYSSCSVDCACEEPTGGTHDIFVVNLQSKPDFAEVFSNPRLLPAAERKGLKGLPSYDIGQGWNFLQADQRKACLDEIGHYKPNCVLVCPPCGPFSPLQACSWHKQNPADQKRKLIEGRVPLDFAMQICELQHSEGRLFAFEHPGGAASWKEPCVERVRNLPGVFTLEMDQCMFGLKDPLNGKAYRKHTRWMYNFGEFQNMACRCDHGHDHQRIEGQIRVNGVWVNRFRCAQVYPKKLVERFIAMYMKHQTKRGHEVLAAVALQEDKTNIQRSVRRCHVNLGHPSKERFLHMLKSAGASATAIEAAKRLKCSICEVHKPYPSHAVAKHKKAQGFDQQVNMDTFDLPIYGGRTLKMLNMICEGTGLQICVPLWKGAQSKHVRSAYRKGWKRWAGVPIRVVTDGGTEFDDVCQQGFEDDGTFVDKTAAYSPHQNGIVERHGGIWKQTFLKAFEG